MQVAINIKNIDLSMLNAIKAMLKTKPEIKFEIKKEQENSHDLILLKESKVFQKWEEKYKNLSKKEQEILNNELEKDILEASYKNDNY